MSIIGIWQLKEFSQLLLDTSDVVRPFGDAPTGYIHYSIGGHMLVFLTAGQLPRPSEGYSDAERAEIHKRIINGYVGTHTVEGNKVIHHVLTSARPDFIGKDQSRFFEINGNVLTIKTAPLKTARSGESAVSTLIFERVE